MSGKTNLKRPSEDAALADHPNKKATNKLGRPMNVGEQQLEFMMSGLPDYAEEKRKKVLKLPNKITKMFDTKTVEFIAKFGWDNPFRTLTKVVVDATDAVRAATQAEADAAAAAVAAGPENTDAAKFAEQKRKDEVVKAVRGEYTKLYQRALRDGVPGAVKPSVDIAKLIRSIMAKPTQRQLYVAWAKLRTRPDLDSEVDRRHAEALKEKGDSSRSAVWDVVASEWFNACSEDEKVITRREALTLLDIEMKSWEDQAASNPSSPGEARAFMEGSEEFLKAMMQFFANRVSGIAVMFLAGPKEVSLSEAVCDTPGQPKVLYSQVAEEETTLRLMGGRILSQSRLLNEVKWGAQLYEDDDGGEDEEGQGSEPMDTNLDPALRQTESQTAPITEAPLQATIAPPATRAANVDEGYTEQAPSTTLGAGIAAPSVSDITEQATVQVTVDAPIQAAAEAKSKAARARALVAKAEAEAAEADAEVAALAAATNIVQDADMGSAYSEPDQPADTVMSTPASAPAASPTLTDAGISAGHASVMAFDPYPTLAGLDEAESEYTAGLGKASLALLSRKSWWDQTNNPAFFKLVPQKLRNGGADVAVGCELSLAYLALEQSAASEQKLQLASVSDKDACMPEYLAKFGEKGRAWAARWHKRMDKDGKRTCAALDYDVGVTLPRQWALIQPQTRLDVQGRIAVPAHASMTWTSGISPGRMGVRALVVTLLVWGSNMKGNEAEQVEWRCVAADVAQVLRILAQQGGEFESNEPGGRKKMPSAKARDSNRST